MSNSEEEIPISHYLKELLKQTGATDTQKVVDEIVKIIAVASQQLEEEMRRIETKIGNDVEGRLVSNLKEIVRSVVKEEMDNMFRQVVEERQRQATSPKPSYIT